MRPYIAIVHKDEHSAYGVSFPDAPGCFSAADEIDDLFANAGEALELWAEGMTADGLELPVPRDLSELHRDAEWAQSFAEAALVMAVIAPQTFQRAA